jgi:hypothetical protein
MSPVVYHFAILRVVPHVHLGAFANVGVILHARTSDFLGMRVLDDGNRLSRLVEGIDQDLLQRYLQRFQEISAGDAAGGPVALLPPSERFHWLTAPRSDVLQASPIHEGVCTDPAVALDKIFREMVLPG